MTDAYLVQIIKYIEEHERFKPIHIENELSIQRQNLWNILRSFEQLNGIEHVVENDKVKHGWYRKAKNFYKLKKLTV